MRNGVYFVAESNVLSVPAARLGHFQGGRPRVEGRRDSRHLRRLVCGGGYWVAAEGEKLSPITVGASGAQDRIAYGKQACGFAAKPETDEGAIVRGCAHAQSKAAKIKFCYP